MNKRLFGVISWSVPFFQIPPEELSLILKTAVYGIPQAVKTVNHAQRGSSRNCWATVERLARKHGKPVGGWSVVKQAPRLPQTNQFAEVVLNAHCVLSSKGKLWETIPERYGLSFIPCSFKLPVNAQIEFFDDEASARASGILELTSNLENIPCTHVVFDLDVPQ